MPGESSSRETIESQPRSRVRLASDRARHFATLYLNDLADVLRDAVDPRFEFVRYAESLAQSQATFEPLAGAA